MPRIRPARELPVYNWSEWDSVSRVKAAIKQMEVGVFEEAAQVVEAMGRDDRIDAALLTRCGALPSLPISFEPMGDGRMKTAAAREAEESWEKLFPDYSVQELLRWGIMLGVGLGELLWTRTEARWTPTLKVWHPRHLHWRDDLQRFVLHTLDGLVPIEPGNGQWILYTPHGTRGWMRGKARSLFVPWLIRQWAWRDWARYSEVHGLPIRKVKTPTVSEENEKKRFMEEVAAIGSESVIRTPVPNATTNPQYDRFDVELLEAVGRSWDCFDKLIEKTSTAITITLLGQNLSTEVKEGSRAATTVHANIKAEVLRGDAGSLSQCLREQALVHWAAYNYGTADVAPMPRYQTDPPENRKEKAETVKLLGEGVQALQLAGAKPDVDEMMEEMDIPSSGPAEDSAALQAMQATTEATLNPPAKPEGGKKAEMSRPLGLIPGRDFKPASPMGDPGPVPQEASMSKDADIRPDYSTLPTKAVEAQLYVDELVEEARDEAAKLISRDLSAVLDIVNRGTDWEEIRTGLVALYPKLDRERMAELTRKVLILAQLTGRHAVREEAREDGTED